MATGIVPKQFQTDFKNLPLCKPATLDIINTLVEEREETLLAVMAAGIPANCIALDDPGSNRNATFDFNNLSINLGFRFVRHI